MLHQAVVEAEDGLRLLSIELQHVAVLHILIHTIEIVHGESLLCGCVQQVDTEREEGLRVTEQSQHGWHDVDLLRHRWAHAWLYLFARGVEDDDG